MRLRGARAWLLAPVRSALCVDLLSRGCACGVSGAFPHGLLTQCSNSYVNTAAGCVYHPPTLLTGAANGGRDSAPFASVFTLAHFCSPCTPLFCCSRFLSGVPIPFRLASERYTQLLVTYDQRVAPCHSRALPVQFLRSRAAAARVVIYLSHSSYCAHLSRAAAARVVNHGRARAR